MNIQVDSKTRAGGLTLMVCWVLVICCVAQTATAQRIIRNGVPNIPNFPEGGPPPGTDASPSPSSSGKDNGPWLPSEPPIIGTSTNASGTNTNDDIQLSFQGANVDMLVQWLAQTTGKTVIKHPRVQCQVTITSSKKVSKREAIVLVYRALAIEGFTAIESAQSILIVPEGQEPKINPEVVSGSLKDLPEGRTRLVKVFSLQHVQAADIRDRIRGALTDKGTVDVNERNNQLIVTDFTDNLRLAGELILALDTDKPEDMAVRVIPLKSVAANALAKEIGPLYQKASGGKSVDVAADEHANALFILSSQGTFESIMQIVSSLDTADAQEKQMETFILKNADAQDVARQLQDLSQSQNGNSRFYYFYGPPDNSAQKKFNVVADRRRNAVIVQAAPSQIPDIKKIIDQLDAPVSDDSLAPKIYHLKYVSAVDIEDVLNELFLKKTQPRSYFDYFDENPAPVVDRDVGRLYGKVRITSDPYSNTLIITSNSKENLAVVEDVINQLDSPSEAGESTMRIVLKYAKASTVANNLNILFAKNGSPPLRPTAQQNQNAANANQQQPQQQTGTTATGFDLEQETKEEGYYPWIGGQPDLNRNSDGRSTTPPVSDLVGRVRAVSDQRGNALLVSANVHFFPQVLKLINDLDAASDQVSIESRILEISADYLDAMGVRFSPDGSQTFTANDYDNSFIAHGSANYQRGFGDKTSVNTPNASSSSTPAANIAQALTQLRSGVVQGSASMDLLVQFLKRNSDATVLGEPQITINDNEMGKLFVGQQVPIPQNTQISSVGSQNTAITYKDVGVVLEVTPHLNKSGDVQLKIHVESSTVEPGQTV
ncbi:MAG TPA: secretin N-terminal domain-containing protein, partial [Verrucomicrobiae bacterium]|nr:secretin N-terminal domain-containing protein [Verrucomicrobiae bacterium]